MKISATSLSTGAELANRRGVGGFTLLELLVVLTLMAAMTSLALPQLSRLFEAGQGDMERRQLLDDLASLPYTAFQEQRGFVLQKLPGQTQPVPLALPEGWWLEAQGEDGVRYGGNGFCSGGTLILGNASRQDEVVLTAPHCKPAVR